MERRTTNRKLWERKQDGNQSITAGNVNDKLKTNDYDDDNNQK